jgi:hypothetical protein
LDLDGAVAYTRARQLRWDGGAMVSPMALARELAAGVVFGVAGVWQGWYIWYGRGGI